MLAQTCPMTTLTVVNVDAADRPAAPDVHDCRRQARSCKIAKVQCRLELPSFGANWWPVLAHTRPTGDPQEQVRPLDGPAALRRRPPRAPIFSRMGFQWHPVKKNTRARTHAGGQFNRVQDHHNTAKLECPMTT